MPPRKPTQLEALFASDTPPTKAVLSGLLKHGDYSNSELSRLAELPSLTELTLYVQTIDRLPEALATLPNLARLVLNDCPNLCTLDGIQHLTQLRALEIRTHATFNLELACARLHELPELTSLTLSGHAVRALPEAIASVPSLIALRLECPLLELTTALATLGTATTLRSLAIDFRVAKLVLPETCAQLRQITQLSLASTRTVLCAGIGEMTNLESLIAIGVSKLPPEIGKLARLRVLDLAASPLQRVPPELCDCTALEWLRLHGNLRALPPRFGELANLRVLHLPDRPLSAPDGIAALRLTTFSGSDDLARRLTVATA